MQCTVQVTTLGNKKGELVWEKQATWIQNRRQIHIKCVHLVTTIKNEHLHNFTVSASVCSSSPAYILSAVYGKMPIENNMVEWP
jgi:hypothetical protein